MVYLTKFPVRGGTNRIRLEGRKVKMVRTLHFYALKTWKRILFVGVVNRFLILTNLDVLIDTAADQQFHLDTAILLTAFAG